MARRGHCLLFLKKYFVIPEEIKTDKNVYVLLRFGIAWIKERVGILS